MIASLIVLLYLTGIISTSSAITSLYIAGIILIVTELGIVSFGTLALNGLIALYAAYTIQSGHDLIFGMSVSWPILFGITLVEISVIATVITVHMRIKKTKAASGTESMIGDTATIIEWNDTKGTVRYDGEIWKAQSETSLELKKDDLVTIQAINKLILKIKNT